MKHENDIAVVRVCCTCGGTPLYKPCTFCAATKGKVFGPFWSEYGYTLFHFVVESGIVFEGTTGVYERVYHFNPK